ncbi:hypothetical protein K3495_g4812 [Podosphaera aphanis]|nr:hypothetical protein K3495_g4812 [Podosphaera aphanis]
MSWLVISSRVLSPQQFGALSLRSATDLTTCLTHDIEEALNRRLTAFFLTLDVKGAFNAVLPGRLVRHLYEQGWPPHICAWVASFATGRQVRIRLDGQIGPAEHIDWGLPQVSPVSPIFFMLYIAPVLSTGKKSTRFGKDDNIAILRTSDSLGANAERLSSDLAMILDWGKEEGVTFDPAKAELLHFSRRRLPDSLPQVKAGSMTVRENTTIPHLRWLGVFFDRKLTLKSQVRNRAAKSMTVAKNLSSLGNTVRGVQPRLLRPAAVACVLPVAYFGAETWRPGHTRPRNNDGTVSNRVYTFLSLHSKTVSYGQSGSPSF